MAQLAPGGRGVMYDDVAYSADANTRLTLAFSVAANLPALAQNFPRGISAPALLGKARIRRTLASRECTMHDEAELLQPLPLRARRSLTL
jgi:hypothetical protein